MNQKIYNAKIHHIKNHQNSKLHNKKNEYRYLCDLDQVNNVASASECTGLIQTPPTNSQQMDSYQDIYNVAKKSDIR